MSKRKSPKEMLAARNPLQRTSVAPVDIYSTPPVPTTPAIPKKQEQPKQKLAPNKSEEPKKSNHKPTTDEIVPYSTYLYKSQVKGIKLRAIERGLKDKEIVQEAIVEYLKNHSL